MHRYILHWPAWSRHCHACVNHLSNSTILLCSRRCLQVCNCSGAVVARWNLKLHIALALAETSLVPWVAGQALTYNIAARKSTDQQRKRDGDLASLQAIFCAGCFLFGLLFRVLLVFDEHRAGKPGCNATLIFCCHVVVLLSLLLMKTGWIIAFGIALEIILVGSWTGTIALRGDVGGDPRHSSSRSIVTPTNIPDEGIATSDRLRKTWETFTVEDDGSQGHSEMCSICLSTYIKGEVVHRLACGHEFHDVCIESWLLPLGSNRRCPMRCAVTGVDTDKGSPPPLGHGQDFDLERSSWPDVSSTHDDRHAWSTAPNGHIPGTVND